MPTRTVTVGSAVGLHARPAAIIAEAAGELDSEVTIGVPGDDPVDASSSLLIMTLGAGKGATVEVSGDDQAAVDKIAALVEQDLDAELPGRASTPRITRARSTSSAMASRSASTPWKATMPRIRATKEICTRTSYSSRSLRSST